MKKALLFLISLFIGIFLLISVIKLAGWKEIEETISVLTGWKGLVIFLFTLSLILVGIWKWKEILKSGGINIHFSDLYKPYFAGFSLMYLFPIVVLGGETFRGYTLKRKNQIPLPKGMASVIIDRILDFTTNLITILFGTLFFISRIVLPSMRMIIIFGGTFFLWVIGISFFYFKVFKRESIVKFVLKMINYKYENEEPLEIEKEFFNFFDLRNIQFWKAVGLALLEETIVFFRTFLLINFLGKHISLLSNLSVVGFYYLAGIIPITAALGSYEVLGVFAFNALGIGAAVATAFSMIVRGTEVIIALIGIPIALKFGFDFLKIFKEE